MKRLILLSVAFASLFFYACDGPKKQSTLTDSTQTVVDTLVYSYQRFTKNDSIVHPTFGTMTISFTYNYPVLADKSKTDLSNYIASLVDKGVSSETVSDDILSQSKEFYKMAKTDYDAAMQALQNDTTQGYLPQAYEQSTSINIQYSDSNTVVIEKAIYSFTGGAHGIYGSTFYNYSQKLHKAFTINDIVAKNNTRKLTAIAEKIFRKEQKLQAKQDLSEGYFFDKGVFALNDNFYVSDSAINFLYNPYEIMSYAQGQYTLSIPFTQIADLLIPNNPIAYLANK